MQHDTDTDTDKILIHNSHSPMFTGSDKQLVKEKWPIDGAFYPLSYYILFFKPLPCHLHIPLLLLFMLLVNC